MTRILIVCRGGQCRGPMLAAVYNRTLMEKFKRADVVVESAGYLEEAKGQPAPRAWDTLRNETGFDLSRHRSTWIGDLNLAIYDRIICLDKGAFDAITKLGWPEKTDVTLVNPRDGGIPDPTELGGIEAYRRCFQMIVEVVRRLPEPRRELVKAS